MTQADQDAELVRRCLDGDKQAFGTLVEQYQRVLFNVALKIVRDADDAADVTQSVFVKAYENLHRYKPKYKFYSWIYRMTVNAALNFSKRHSRLTSLETQTIESRTTPADDYARGELSDRVEEAMFELAPEDRAILSLKYTAELSYRDIAYVFDVAEKTVKSRLYTARQRLKDVLISGGFDAHGRA